MIITTILNSNNSNSQDLSEDRDCLLALSSHRVTVSWLSHIAFNMILTGFGEDWEIGRGFKRSCSIPRNFAE